MSDGGVWIARHCKRGHALNNVNTYINPRGHRQCRPCGALRASEKRRHG